MTDSFDNGLQVGNKFWVWGLDIKKFGVFQQCNMIRTETYIWYIKKQVWRVGPKLKHEFRKPTTSTAINASHVIFVTRSELPPEDKLQTLVFDFITNTWTFYPIVQSTPINNYFETCAIAILISKRDRRVYLSCLVHSNLVESGYSNMSLPFSTTKRIMVSYNLDEGNAGTWTFESETEMIQDPRCKYCNSSLLKVLYFKHFYLVFQRLLATNGMLFSFDHVKQHESIGYIY